MDTSRHEEVERKYDLGPTDEVPSLLGVGGIASEGSPQTHELVAVYYDTDDERLLRHGVTLRVRSGGHDAGWTVKLPSDGDARTEVHVRSDGSEGPPPAAIVAEVRAVVRDRELRPVARIRSVRVERVLEASDGNALLSVTDDDVTAERIAGEGESGTGPMRWRELEVEVVDGPASLLDDVEAVLVAEGISRAGIGSKLARTLTEGTPSPGKGAPASQPTPTSDRSRPRTLDHALTRLLAEHRGELLAHDRGVRRSHAESVHRMRIAARRIRSALTTYRSLLQHEPVDALRADLKWLGQSLGPARDAQVLRAHLDAAVSQEPPELLPGPVAGRIAGELSTQHQEGLVQAQQALDETRYFRLLDALDRFAEAPPWSGGAGAEKARAALPKLVARDAKRLRRAVRTAREASPERRDAALHEVRKKAKRLRYAAEGAVPTVGRHAAKLAKRAKAVQRSLGDHQDSVVARQRLRELGVHAHLAGENGFAFGRLHGLEERRAELAVEQFGSAWRRLHTKQVRRRLGG